MFTRTHQWQNQAQYELGPSQVCGFKQVEEREGEIELVLYYGTKTPEHARVLFKAVFERFLRKHDVRITEFPSIRCTKCRELQDRASTVRRMRDRKRETYCSNCGTKIELPKVDKELTLNPTEREGVEREQRVAKAKTTFEAALVQLKRLISGRTSPSCFISYAWGTTNHEQWVGRFARDLEAGQVSAIWDKRSNSQIGDSLPRFIAKLVDCNFVVVVGTPEYVEKYENKTVEQGSVVAAEMDLVNRLLIGSEKEKKKVLPALLAGNDEQALPPLLRGKVYADFRKDEDYFAVLFDLLLTIHDIPLAHAGLREIRTTLRKPVLDV